MVLDAQAVSVPGYVESLLGGLQQDVKRVLTESFRYVLPNGKFGPVAHQQKSENFQAYYVTSTTATSTGEFSIVHGLGRVPYFFLVVGDLSAIGSGVPVLRVSRAADGQRVYFKAEAGSTNMPFSVLLE